MSFGFSVGDFITVTKLIAELVGSLQDVGGSKSEYQELLRELENLRRALQHVDKLNGQAVDSIKCAALMCRHPLEEFLYKIRKYERSLGLGKSNGVIKDTARKIEWSFGKRDEVRKLRDYLNIHIGSINMLLMSHGLEMLDVASEQADKYREDFQKRLDESCHVMVQIRSDIRAQALIVHRNQSMLKRLFGTIRGDIAAPLKSLAEMISKICMNTQQIYGVVLELRSFLPVSPCPDTRFTFFQAPVRVEDALGRIFHFPSEYSYDDLEAIIQCRFKAGPGHDQVKAGEWELCNRKNTKQVISRDTGVGLLPGMNVTMAILMIRSNKTGDCCPMPRCQSTRTILAAGGGRICCECKVWFDQSSKKRKRVSAALDDGPFEEVELLNPPRMKRAKLQKRGIQPSVTDCNEELEVFKNVRTFQLLQWRSIRADLARGSPHGRTQDLPEHRDANVDAALGEPRKNLGPWHNSDVIKCICGFDEDDGSTVLCEKCNTWQHVVCYYQSSRLVPEIHECTECFPRTVHVREWSERQRHFMGLRERVMHFKGLRERRGQMIGQGGLWSSSSSNT